MPSLSSSRALKKFSCLKLGGTSQVFTEIKDFLKEPERSWPEPIRFLGNGSNVLIDEAGLRGSVVHCRGFQALEPISLGRSKEYVDCEWEASVFMPALSRWASAESLSGCEYMIGVPGCLGGGVVQNAGAHEQEIRDLLQSVKVFNLGSRRFEELSAQDCQLKYRSSIFLERPEFLIVGVSLRLRPGDSATIQSRMESNLKYRKEKTPWTQATLGSTFARIPKPEGGWHYPGQLLEAVGMKGQSQGGVMFSDLHANYLVNTGEACFADAMQLIREAQKRVHESFGLKLPLEIHLWSDRLGEFPESFPVANEAP